MSAHIERLEFAPPPTPGLLRAVALAILAHGLLLAVLAAGVAWKRAPAVASVAAELWSAVPEQAAAPAPLETPPPAPEPPAPVPEPPKPEPKPDVKPPPDTRQADADIALAKKKAKEEKELRLEKLAQEKKEKLAKEKLEKEKAKQAEEKLAQEKLAKEKLQQDKLAKEKAAKAQEAKEAKMLEELRQQNLKRMAGLAGTGGSGQAGSSGTAMQDSGPSAGYAGRIIASIRPNIVYTENIPTNLLTEVEIRTASSGAILSAKIIRSSGVKSWDEAVLRAIEKTEILPKDTDGRIPTTMQLFFKPRS